MKYWRMAMREGTGGRDRFPDCRARGIAALDFWADDGRRVISDCRSLNNEREYDDIWRKRRPKAVSPRTSLRHLWLHMKTGDVIYAKTGTRVVGKGRIVAEYAYDPKILALGEDWAHYVRVDWEEDFPEFHFKFHAPLSTVMPVEGVELRRLQAADKAARRHQRVRRAARVTLPVEAIPEELAEAVEGKMRKRLVWHRQRERRLRAVRIRQALIQNGGRLPCEVPGCGFDFEKVYGGLGREFAQVHHTRPLAESKGPGKTRLKDLAVICANCHAMIHRGGKCRPMKGLISRGDRRAGKRWMQGSSNSNCSTDEMMWAGLQSCGGPTDAEPA